MYRGCILCFINTCCVLCLFTVSTALTSVTLTDLVNQQSYTSLGSVIYLPFNATRLRVAATSLDTDAVLSLNGTASSASLSTEVQLELGLTWLQLTVTSDGQVVSHTYLVHRNGEREPHTWSAFLCFVHLVRLACS
jgi:hypothetical protein